MPLEDALLLLSITGMLILFATMLLWLETMSAARQPEPRRVRVRQPRQSRRD